MLIKLGLTSVLMLGVATAALAEEAATPMDGGKLVFVAPYGNSITSLDVTATPHTQDAIVAKAINRSLYRWNPETGQPDLDLAESVEKSEDGKTYTYKLREATFHNGDTFDADDVIWSFNRLADPANALPGVQHVLQIEGVAEVQAGEADEISGLKKIDDRTVQITFTNKADPGWSLMKIAAPIYSSEYPADKLASEPVGLGPFKLVEYVPGSKARLVKFDDFYIEGKPHLDELSIMFMGDASARDIAFRNGEIDASILGPTQYQAYSQDATLKEHILEVAEVYTRNIGFNPDVEAFQDKRVRQAINYAINADLIIEKLVRNKAYRAVSWLPISSPAFDKTAEPYPYDPEKAKELLKAAGYEDGFSFSVTATPNESWGIPIVEAVIPMLAKVGITATVDPVEPSVLSDKITSDNFQAFIWSNESGPNPLNRLRCFHSTTPQGACNYVKFSNAEFDELIDKAGEETDPAKRNEILKQANNLLQEEAPVWFFNYNKAVMAYQPWVHGLQANPKELALQEYADIWIDASAPDSRK